MSTTDLDKDNLDVGLLEGHTEKMGLTLPLILIHLGSEGSL